MKYRLLIYGNQEKWDSTPAESWPEEIAKYEAFNAKYRETGELLGAYGLADAVAARLVRRFQPATGAAQPTVVRTDRHRTRHSPTPLADEVHRDATRASRLAAIDAR